MLRLGLAAESMSHPKRVASIFNSGIYEGIDMARPRSKICGVGVNDSPTPVVRSEYVNGKRVQVWVCEYYSAWKNMITRCYSDRLHKTNPTYKGCSVCDSWHKFSNFKSWMKKQDWKGKQLDKDLLIQGNKVYRPEACVFVTGAVNRFICDAGAIRGNFKIGVTLKKDTGMYVARCCNPFTGDHERLGQYKTEDEAHNAWRLRKLELSDMLLLSGLINRKIYSALIKRYSNGS